MKKSRRKALASNMDTPDQIKRYLSKHIADAKKNSQSIHSGDPFITSLVALSPCSSYETNLRLPRLSAENTPGPVLCLHAREGIDQLNVSDSME